VKVSLPIFWTSIFSLKLSQDISKVSDDKGYRCDIKRTFVVG